MQEQELLALARDARTLFAANAGKSWLVAPSAPVLFFGDLPGFGESTPRVATVALNPSRREFPAADPFKRFPGAESARRRLISAVALRLLPNRALRLMV